MDEVCTTAFDGECEVYKRFGLDRVVVLRYVDGSGAPEQRRGQPLALRDRRRRVRDVHQARRRRRRPGEGHGEAARRPGGAGATSSSNAYVWRGQYLAELTFVTEDTKMTPEAMAQANEQSTGADRQGHRRQASRPDRPAALGRARCPPRPHLPLGVAYYPKDALGADGDRPGRGRATTRTATSAGVTSRSCGATPTPPRRRSALQAASPGARPSRAWATRRCRSSSRRPPIAPRRSTSSRGKAPTVVAVGDEELVLDPGRPATSMAPLKLAHDEKLVKLAALLR